MAEEFGGMLKNFTQELMSGLGKELEEAIKEAQDQIEEAQKLGQCKIFLAEENARLPTLGTEDSAGYDLYSTESCSLYPGEFKLLSTGLIIQPPKGFHVEVMGRSGLGVKYGIHLAQGVGLIDRDYAGEGDVLRVPLHRSVRDGACASSSPLQINVGDRIGQMVFRSTYHFELVEVESPPASTTRDGFGSTGK